MLDIAGTKEVSRNRTESRRNYLLYLKYYDLQKPLCGQLSRIPSLSLCFLYPSFLFSFISLSVLKSSEASRDISFYFSVIFSISLFYYFPTGNL